MKTIWFCGNDEETLTSIAELVGEELINRDKYVELIVHSEVQEVLGRGLKDSSDDKSVFADRLGFLGNLLHRNGVFALIISKNVSLNDRKSVKSIYGNYLQVNLDTKDELTDIALEIKGPVKAGLKAISTKIIDYLVKEGLISELGQGANVYSKDEEEEIRRRLEDLGYV